MALTIEIEWNGAYYYITVKRGKKYCTTDISRSKSLHGAFKEAELLVKRVKKEAK
jgi:protein involved in sex pheromone biosynthesis